MKWFRGGLVFKTHKLLYHSTLGWTVIKKKKKKKVEGNRTSRSSGNAERNEMSEPAISGFGLGFRV